MPIEFRRATLPNGLNILAEIDPTAYTAGMGFFVKTGARDEHPGVMGVSHFLEHMMFKGTATRAAAQVDSDFDDIGAEHNAFTTSEMTAFWAHTLPEHLPRAGEILADILRPALRPADFDTEKNVILEEIAMYEDNPFWVLYERTIEEYYGANPLSHRVLGTAESITNLKRDQMMEYFTQRYSADNTVVAMAGKIDFDGMASQLAAACGHWNTTRAGRIAAPVPRQTRDFTVNSETVNRHYMLMMAPAPSQQDDRRFAASMLAQVLGDAEGSRLFWALVETGLADEAQSQFDGRDGLGEYLVYCSCSPDNAAEVKRIAIEQMKGLAESLTESDLERIKSRIATAATLHSELPAGRMRRLGRSWLYHGEYHPLEREIARINRVTLDELRRVHREFPIEPVTIGHLMPGETSEPQPH